MDHAEAHERIGDLALERRISTLAASAEPEDAALRAHVATCDECRTELEDLRNLQNGLSDALAGIRTADVARIGAPSDLRTGVLAVAHKERPAAAAPAPARAAGLWRPRWSGLSSRLAIGLAAALTAVVVVAGAFYAGDQNVRLQSAEADRRALVAAVATVSRVLADPSPSVDTLAEANGVATGTVAWSRHDLVVLANGLPAPTSGTVYRCWVVSDQGDTAVGKMDFVDGAAFWVGSLDGWASIDLSPGYQFLVTLEPITASTQQHTGPVVLQATLGA